MESDARRPSTGHRSHKKSNAPGTTGREAEPCQGRPESGGRRFYAEGTTMMSTKLLAWFTVVLGFAVMTSLPTWRSIRDQS